MEINQNLGRRQSIIRHFRVVFGRNFDTYILLKVEMFFVIEGTPRVSDSVVYLTWFANIFITHR